MREGTGTWDQLKQLAPWSNWLLSYSCCGPQVSARLGQYAQLERDPLMGGSISPPEEQMMAGGTNLVSHPSASSAEAGPRLLLVMRHAHREDEDNEDWAVMAARPWDPPLSQLGRRQAREAAQVLAAQQGQLQIDYVVSSPYLRCLQTSAELVAALQLPEGRWLVDWAMGEMGEPRLLLSGRPDLEAELDSRPIESWMWDGLTAAEALQKFMHTDEPSVSNPGVQPQLLGSRPVPPWPEAAERAVQRYTSELKWIQAGGMFRGNVLVVTHGEAVRSAVNTMLPDATVYEVRHCAYAKLRLREGSTAATGDNTKEHDEHDSLLGAVRDAGPGRGAGQGTTSSWELAVKSGETGISWFA